LTSSGFRELAEPAVIYNSANHPFHDLHLANMTNDGNNSYAYDADGNMTQVGGGSIGFVYNALNQRIEITYTGGSLEFVFGINGKRVSTWQGSTGELWKGMTYWGEQPVEFYSSGYAHFPYVNWLGTTRGETDFNGSIDSSYTSLPFGDGWNMPQGEMYDSQQFAGMDSDTASIEHTDFREYSAMSGRWMSPDPFGGSYDFSNPQSFNRYAYVQNNPISATDPSGLMMCAGGPCLDTGGGSFNAPGGVFWGWGSDETYDYGKGLFDNGMALLDHSLKWDPNEGAFVQQAGWKDYGSGWVDYGSSTNFGGVVSSYSGGGGGVSKAPINATPWYKSCTANALLSNAGSIALDAVGTFVPAGGAAEGAVAGAFSLWRGAAGVSQGRNVFRGVMLAGGVVNTASAGSEGNSVSAGLGVLGVAATLGKTAPGVGQIISGISMGVDIVQTIQAVGKCQ
jgi:RHS repeat-associated protein